MMLTKFFPVIDSIVVAIGFDSELNVSQLFTSFAL
jgi:hypothetical protein